ncbi:putative malate dehydrogenase 1B isoform X2 [Mustelus asterias]
MCQTSRSIKLSKHPRIGRNGSKQCAKQITGSIMIPRLSGENLWTAEERDYCSVDSTTSWSMHRASSPVCVNLIPTLVNGELFGRDREVSLHLMDINTPLAVLEGLQWDVEDMAYPLLQKVTVQNSLRKAFMDAEVIIVLDDFTPEEDQPIEDCYKEIAGFYQELAVRIDTFARSNARVIVAGDHILNLKTYFLLNNAYSIDHCNFVAVSTQLEVEVKALLAKKLNVKTEDVKDVILWGNLGRSIYIDLHRTRVSHYESAIWGPPDFSRSVHEVLYDRNWVEEEFLEEVYSHRPKIQAALGKKLGFSLAAAIENVLHWWYFDSPPGEIVSLGVISQGEFDIPPGLVFSMPVRFCGGKWMIQSQIEISEETKDKLKHIAQELKLEQRLKFYPVEENEGESNVSSHQKPRFEKGNDEGRSVTF